MKYELLKRTAIALFVGSVISTYSVAEGSKISTKSSLEDIASAINKNDENISKIKTDVSDLAKSLKGDDQNPGLLDALAEANKGLNENKEALALKADQSAVDDINAELDTRAKALKTLQEEKASVKDLNAISENVKEGFDSIQDKVHNLQEALAGDGTDEKPGLIKSVSSAVEELNDNIAKKADKDTVDAELAKKANQADVEANKAEIAKFGAQTNSNAALLLTMAGKVDQNKKDTDEAIAKLEENQDTFNEGFRNELDAANQTLDEHEAAIDKLKETQTYKDLSKVETLVKDKADKTAVEKNASRITDTRNKQALQNARLDNHGERIEANEAAIGELAKATDKAVTNLGDTVRDLDADLAGTQDAVAENRKDIDKNASRITDTRNKQVLQNARLDNHGERIEANEAAIGELAKATDESVKNLGNAVNDLDENLAGTQEAVAENRKDIDKNASRITDTRNKQVLQNARLDNHSSRIDANKAALETKADKTALEAKADKTALEAKADKTALEAKADKVYVGSLEQNIRDNSNRIETNKVAVSALRNDINSHAKRLDHLDNRVNKLDKDLKRGLATQAALTGLFQPYTVGKANFTAAVGGYKSQTAVAIGTGYRYNKHVATKAGVAFTQGGAAYNVGVNFEW